MVKSRQAITALIEQGASTEARNSVGKTALHVMCDRRNLKCLLRLLACDANPDAQDDNGNTPMHCAVLTHKAINSKSRYSNGNKLIPRISAHLLFIVAFFIFKLNQMCPLKGGGGRERASRTNLASYFGSLPL